MHFLVLSSDVCDVVGPLFELRQITLYLYFELQVGIQLLGLTVKKNYVSSQVGTC